MSGLLAIQWATSAALVCATGAVVVGLVYVRRTLRSQRDALAELAQCRATYIELVRRLHGEVAPPPGHASDPGTPVSLKCRIYGDRPHWPCAGTTDDGTDTLCGCWCHLIADHARPTGA